MEILDREIQLNEADLDRIITTYGDMLFRICLVILSNERDAEDVVQETFITYFTKKPTFQELEHEKAWLITVATNRCKNIQRFNIIRKQINIDHLQLYSSEVYNYDLLEDLMRLSPKHKTVLVLYYVEGYKINEIAEILNITSAAVKKRLQRGREGLRENYRRENAEYEI